MPGHMSFSTRPSSLSVQTLSHIVASLDDFVRSDASISIRLFIVPTVHVYFFAFVIAIIYVVVSRLGLVP